MKIEVDDDTNLCRTLQEILKISHSHAKCSVQLNFGGNADSVSLRYINIESEEFNKIYHTSSQKEHLTDPDCQTC
jgi:myo-inositol-1-phosphate synthase